MHQKIITELTKMANPIKRDALQKYFKTGPGGYAEGDIFMGITVPHLRLIARKYADISMPKIQTLLKSPIHEHRLLALMIMCIQYKKADEFARKKIVDMYLKNTKHVNNWDLVDSSAHYILGAWLDGKDISILYKLAVSKNLWEQRIAIIATYHFIRKNEFDTTLYIASLLLHHPHDLIHKAVGWMLREVGNRNPDIEKSFLQKYYKAMPRTMLRYAIEKFEKPLYKKYLNGLV